MSHRASEELLLGIDIGTSAVKGIICDVSGQTVAPASREHEVRTPHPGWAEEPPTDWWHNVGGVIRDCLNGSDVTSDCVTAIGVIGMLPTVLLLNEEGAPLRPSIQQNDARTTEEIEALNATLDPQTLFEMTGAALRQQSVRPKLLWLQRYEPEIWAQTRHIVGSYSYIAARLTDVITAEINWALESALYDPNSELWAAELPASSHVPDALVPHIHRPAES